MKAHLLPRLSLLRACTHLSVAAALVVAPLPAIAAPAEADAAEPAAPAADEAEAAAAQQVGGSVALLRFDLRADWAEQLRNELVSSLEGEGFTTKGISVGLAQAAAKVKCSPTEDECLDRISQYLNKNAKTPFDYYLYLDADEAGRKATVVIYDIANKTKYVTVDVGYAADDLVLPIVLPGAIARKLAHKQQPPPPVSDEEREMIAALDEPEKTPEEIAEEERILAQAKEAQRQQYASDPEAAVEAVDLKRDFDKVCRKGPREDRVEEQPDGSKEKVRDLRPACSRGPFWGYWQPRAWVTASLAGVGALATLGLYGMTLGARGQWKDAKSALESSGLDPHDPENLCDGGVCYGDLAGEVSEASDKVRRRALAGDIALGATVLLSGVLVVIIGQDRAAAKRYIATERELNMADLRVAPMIGGGDTGTAFGAMAGFRF